MKKVILVGIITLLISLFIFPLDLNAAKSGIRRSSSGQVTYSYGSEETYNGNEFKYGISAMTGGGSKITFYGWGFIRGADSYEGYANTYYMQVTVLNSSGNVVATLPYEVKATNQSLDLTCASYVKDGKVFTSNSVCRNKSSASTSSIVSHIRNGNKKVSSSSRWNQIYRNVGFYVSLDLNRITEELKKYYGYTCPGEADLRDPSCSTVNNCTWDGDKCTFTKGGAARIGFRLKLVTPSGATRNVRTFYRDVGVYDTKSVQNSGGTTSNIIEPSTTTVLSNYGYSMTAGSLSKKVITTADYGLVRDSNLAYGNNIKVGGKNLYLAGTTNSVARRTLNLLSRKVYPYTKYPSSNSNSRVFMHGFRVGGKVITGKRGNGSEPATDKILVASSSNSMAGWISESWTVPAAGKLILTVDLKTTCNCLPSLIDLEQTGSIPSSCKDETQKASVNDKIVLNKGLNEQDYDTNQALKVLLLGNDAIPGVRYDADKLKESREETNYSTTSTPVYCLKNRDFKLFGRNDVLGALTLGERDKYLYAGRYFVIDDDKMNASVKQTCISSNASELEKVLKAANIDYDLTYEPSNTLKTDMINNKNQGKLTSSNSDGSYIGTITTNYKMENNRQYYFDYDKNEVVIKPEEGEYIIDDKNIYPIPVDTKPNKSYDIETTMEGNDIYIKGQNETNKYIYTCDYFVKEPSDPDDPEDPDEPGENIPNNANYYYRNISLTDVFPSHRGNMRPYNWRNVNIEKEIEKKGVSIYAQRADYSVVLTTNQMQKIRRYNINKEDDGGYLDNSLECEINNGVRENCRSTFLNNIVEDGYAESFERKAGGN